MQEILVKLCDKKLKVGYKTKVKDVLVKFLDKEKLNKVLAVKVNNQVRSVNEELVLDSVLEPLTYNDSDGYKVYIRTAKLILYLALKRIAPKLKVELCNTIDNSCYFICHGTMFTQEIEDKLNSEIKNIISENITIKKATVSYEEAIAIYKLQNDLEKLENMDIKLNSNVSMCSVDGFFTTMYGVVAPNTGCVSDIKVKKFRKGFELKLKDAGLPGYEDLGLEISNSSVYSVFEEFNEYSEKLGIVTVADLNKRIINGSIDKVVKTSEEIQIKKMEEITNNILANPKIKVILISGPSSSGKTTFAARIGQRLMADGITPLPISMDNYFKERVDTPKLENGEYDFETVDALDLELFNNHMEKLLMGQEIDMPEFNFFTGEKEYKNHIVKLEPKTVIILEGIHALNPIVTKKISDDIKYKIYIAPMTTLNMDDFSKVSTTDTRMLRRMVRDFKTRGHSIDKTLDMWKNVTLGEKKYIYPFIKEADYIFNTSLIYEVAALSVYAKPLLLQINMENKNYSEARRLYNFLANFLPLDDRAIPKDSLIREFIG